MGTARRRPDRRRLLHHRRAVVRPRTDEGSGLPRPATPLFGAVADPYPLLQSQTTCQPNAKPGAIAFRDLVLSAYPETSSAGISRACEKGATSEHKEGRAWDWRLSAFDAHQTAIANTALTWLLGPDEFGNGHAMGRRFGVMYVIWNRSMFRLYDPAKG